MALMLSISMCTESRIVRNVTEFEQLNKKQKEHLLQSIYKISFQLEREGKREKKYKIKWEQLLGKDIKFTASQTLRENWYKMILDGI